LLGLRFLREVHRILVFWATTPCHWVGPFAFSGRYVEEEHLFEPSEREAFRSFQTSRTALSAIGRQTPKDLNPLYIMTGRASLISDNILRAALVKI